MTPMHEHTNNAKHQTQFLHWSHHGFGCLHWTELGRERKRPVGAQVEQLVERNADFEPTYSAM